MKSKTVGQLPGFDHALSIYSKRNGCNSDSK